MYRVHKNNTKTIGIRRIDNLEKQLPTQKEEMMSARQQAEQELSQVKNELEQLSRKKEDLITSTKAEINKEKENWEEEKKKWIASAEKEGYETGLLRGKEDIIQQFSSLIEQANTITETAITDYNKTIEKSEETILDLAIHTAGKIMKQKMEEDPAAFLPIVKAAIKELKDQREISIYLHPDQYHTVMEQKDELAHILEDDMKLSIYVKEHLAVNGCLIHHPFGQIDVSIDTQLEQIRNALFELAMENRS